MPYFCNYYAVQGKADVGQKTKFQSPLFLAASLGHEHILEQSLNGGADLGKDVDKGCIQIGRFDEAKSSGSANPLLGSNSLECCLSYTVAWTWSNVCGKVTPNYSSRLYTPLCQAPCYNRTTKRPWSAGPTVYFSNSSLQRHADWDAIRC